MRSYIGILLIALISCNTIVTDTSKYESVTLKSSEEVHLKELIESVADYLINQFGEALNASVGILDKKHYQPLFDELKKILNELKTYVKEHSLK